MLLEQIKNTLNSLLANYPNTVYYSTDLVYRVGRENGMTYASVKTHLMTSEYKCGRGQFAYSQLRKQIDDGTFTPVDTKSIKVKTPKAKSVASPAKFFNALPAPFIPVSSSVSSSVPSQSAHDSSMKITTMCNDGVNIPEVDATFVSWGEYKTVQKVIDSGMFFPIFISGLSGNGKTMMVEQACAATGREYIRVQISPETDEDDLIGGFRLINGETVFNKGPVIKAMERGAILLIDEIDRGSNKIMCLQGVLEGKPVLIKKIGEVVFPSAGFNIIATANTKGRGSDDGRFSAATIIDEAFLERFVATIDQPYPSFRIERNILKGHSELYGVNDDDFVDKLVNWSSVIRKTYDADGVDEVISTRRLCHIVKAYSIFRNRETSIAMCISRFETETKEAFLDLYSKIDSGVLTAESPASAPSLPQEEHPF